MNVKETKNVNATNVSELIRQIGIGDFRLRSFMLKLCM